MRQLNIILYLYLWHKSDSFCFPSCHYRYRSFLGTTTTTTTTTTFHVVKEPSTTTTSAATTTEEYEDELSDTDTRVLESMLQETKLDLETEADIRKLLERGKVKKVSTTSSSSSPETKQKEAGESDYTSTIFKTLGDTKLWKKLSTQASDVLESVSIWIGNKVEQDVKTLAALGFFAWERAVRDVGRALPQAGELSKKTVFLITNTSSVSNDVTKTMNNNNNIKDKMLRPQDEIQAVSREIRGILSGQQRSSSGRNLRTIAPAGSSNNAERLRRAYQQSRIAERQKKDLTKVPGKVVDSAWELRRELQAETNEPGYKSKPLRNAIAAGVATTGNLLQSVREQAKLAAAKRKEERLLRPQELRISDDLGVPSAASRIEDRVRPAVSTTSSADVVDGDHPMDPYVAARMEYEKASNPSKSKSTNEDIDSLTLLRNERKRILQQIALCVDDPSKSWLEGFSGDESLEKETVLNVVTKMVVLRNDIEEREEYNDEQSAEIVLNHLYEIKRALDEIVQVAETTLSLSIVRLLKVELYGYDPNYDVLPLILRLDRIQSLNDLSTILDNENTVNDAKTASSASSTRSTTTRTIQMTPEIIDVVTETPIKSSYQSSQVLTEDTSIENEIPNVVVEVVLDDDDDNDSFAAADRAKKTVKVTDNEDQQEESEVTKLVLRSLDIVFFVVEKTLFSVIPQALTLSKTVFQRAMTVNELGRGRRGWEPFSKLGNARAKY